MPFDAPPGQDEVVKRFLHSFGEKKGSGTDGKGLRSHAGMERAPTPDRFSHEQKRRSEEFESRRQEKESTVHFPVADLELAMIRLGVKNEAVQEIAQKIANGDVSMLPSEVIVHGDDGQTYLDLNKVGKVAGRIHELGRTETATLVRLLLALDKDLTLQGKPSREIKSFREARNERAAEVATESREHATSWADYAYELVDERSVHTGETPEAKEAYLEIQSYAQDIVDDLFLASGLTQFVPKVHLTKDKTGNAFVFTMDQGNALKEYAETAKNSDEPLELPIFINFGLIKQAKSTDEIAGVLAHEFSHLLQPDYIGQKDSERSKRLEYDADATGMRIADAAGYNPRGLIELFRRGNRTAGSIISSLYGSHPESQNRLIELEKLFHRGELPLPNAQLPLREKPEGIQEAIKTVEASPERVASKGLFARDADDLLETLKESSGPELFLHSENYKRFEGIEENRIFKKRMDLELAHGLRGYRDMALSSMSIFLQLLKDKERFETENPDHDLLFGTMDVGFGNQHSQKRIANTNVEELLNISDEDDTLTPGEKIEKIAYNAEAQAESTKSTFGMEEMDPSIISMETWLDIDNVDVQPFWDFIAEQAGLDRPLEQHERLYYIKSMLGYCTKKPSAGISSSSFGHQHFLTVSRRTIVKREKTIVDPDQDFKKASKLSELPVGLRAHQKKKKDNIKYKTVEYDDTQKQDLFWSGEEYLYAHSRVWRMDPKDVAPIFREEAEEIEKKTLEAYIQVLEEDGMTDINHDAAAFVLQSLLAYSKNRGWGQGWVADFAFNRVKDMSIQFLEDAVRILEQKSLKKMFKGAQALHAEAQDQMIAKLKYLLAFGVFVWKDEDVASQREYQRMFETDPALHLDKGTAISVPVNVENDHFSWNKPSGWGKDTRGIQPTYVQYNIEYPDLEAMSARVWVEMKEHVSAYLDGADLEDEDVPLGFKFAEPTDEDYANARLGIEDIRFDFLPEKKREKNREIASRRKDAEEIFARFLAISRAYREYLYTGGALAEKTLTALAVREKYMQGGGSSHGSRDFPISMRPLRDMCIGKIAAVGQRGKENATGPVVLRARTGKKASQHLWNMNVRDLNIETELGYARKLDARNIQPTDIAAVESVTHIAKGKKDNGLPWALYRDKRTLATPLHGDVRIDTEQLTTYLEMKAKESPEGDHLLKIVKSIWEKYPRLQKDRGGHYGNTLLLLLTGNHVQYQKIGELSTEENIELWRAVSAVYKDEWKDLEAYKRLDEQMAHWEWHGDNPFFEDQKFESKNNPHAKPPPMSLSEFITWEYGDATYSNSLSKIYRIDSRNVSGIPFSWPLFMQDVWNGTAIDLYKNREHQKEFEKHVADFRTTLQGIVDDPDNLETVLAMQPGFFKEFILDKKLANIGLSSLEEVEDWLEHFSETPHEGTERNQIPLLVESEKSGVLGEKQKEIIREVLKERDMEEYADALVISHSGGRNTDARLAVEDIYLDIETYKLPGKTADERKEQNLIPLLGDIQRKYSVRIRDEYTKLAAQEGVIGEHDIYVFTDEVIEEEESKLEIGPAYRLRMVSQPLMDWHVESLASAASAEEARALATRVDKDIPGRHPMKDLFLKNQLHIELWHMVQSALPPEVLAEKGLSLSRKDIDLTDALKKYPLYAEASFLSSYSLFEVEGLFDAVDDLPPETQAQILNRIEEVVESEISEDQKPALRRLLFQLEKAVQLPKLKKDREKNPEVFDTYLERVTRFYPTPSYERDDILETMCMELAFTPEQIRKVWSERYEERVKWPEEREAAAIGAQFQAFEKMRAMSEHLEPCERAEYILWFIGGDTPMAEQLSVEKTELSLENRKEAFWQMTATERRHLLYDMLVGKKGVLDEKAAPTDYFSRKSSSGKEWQWEKSMIRFFSGKIFDQTFGDKPLDPVLPKDHKTNTKGKEMMDTIFTELFVAQSSPARRAELMINIVEAVGEAKQQGKELSPGAMIKLLLEQVGVVGIKAGQVLSEQPGLLPESIRLELEQLKDQTSAFSKRGTLAYTEAGGWVQGNIGKITEIRGTLGSASIKKVDDGILDTGERVAIKAKRPSIDKNFEDDLMVLQHIIERLNSKGFEVPEYLLKEVERVSRDELEFGNEVENQQKMAEILAAKKASIGLSFGNTNERAPITVAKVHFASEDEKKEADIGLVVEEFVQGLPLKDVAQYQIALQSGDKQTIQKMRDRVKDVYQENSLVKVIEQNVARLHIDRLKAALAVEFLDEVVRDGMFHADLHEGNIYVDLHPLDTKVTLIDLGSMGFSSKEAMPEHALAKAPEEYDARGDFRDFMTAFFSPSMNHRLVEEIVNKYSEAGWGSGNNVDANNPEPGGYVKKLVEGEVSTEGKIKKILYSILEQADQGMDEQFRYLLKALATAAGHFDKLKDQLAVEMDDDTEDPPAHYVLPKIMKNELINFEVLFSSYINF